MLILTRSQNESVIIDGDIKVTVLSDNYGQVKLGIDAPDDVEIWWVSFASGFLVSCRSTHDPELLQSHQSGR